MNLNNNTMEGSSNDTDSGSGYDLESVSILGLTLNKIWIESSCSWTINNQWIKLDSHKKLFFDIRSLTSHFDILGKQHHSSIYWLIFFYINNWIFARNHCHLPLTSISIWIVTCQNKIIRLVSLMMLWVIFAKWQNIEDCITFF